MSSTAPVPEQSENAGEPRPEKSPTEAAALVFDDPLAQQSSDDTDQGWGESSPRSGSAADLARFLDEKPPHHF